MMKRLISLMMIICISLTLGGCFDKKEDTRNQQNSGNEATNNENSGKEDDVVPLGERNLTIGVTAQPDRLFATHTNNLGYYTYEEKKANDFLAFESMVRANLIVSDDTRSEEEILDFKDYSIAGVELGAGISSVKSRSNYMVSVGLSLYMDNQVNEASVNKFMAMASALGYEIDKTEFRNFLDLCFDYIPYMEDEEDTFGVATYEFDIYPIESNEDLYFHIHIGHYSDYKDTLRISLAESTTIKDTTFSN